LDRFGRKKNIVSTPPLIRLQKKKKRPIGSGADYELETQKTRYYREFEESHMLRQSSDDGKQNERQEKLKKGFEEPKIDFLPFKTDRREIGFVIIESLRKGVG